MKRSLSFDWAADFYDLTRTLPEEVAAQGLDAILREAGPGARILDVGTGTGRISVPLLERGADLIGCDISTKMMALLRAKFPAAQLAVADASMLPFPGASFGAVITCHVMHLVGPWHEALHEYRRVLKPAGVYINIETEAPSRESAKKKITGFWRSRVESHGGSTRRPGAEDEKELRAALRDMGATMHQIEAGRYSRSYTAGDVLKGIADRTHSSARIVPDDIFPVTLQELRAWFAQEYPDPEAEFQDERTFVLDVARFDRERRE